MALQSMVYKTCLKLSPSVTRQLYKHLSNNVDKTISLEVDALDDFTSQLMQRKTEKWELQKVKAKKLVELVDNHVDKGRREKTQPLHQIENLTEDKINSLLQLAIENENYTTLLNLMNQCIIHVKVPSTLVMFQILSYSASKGDKIFIKRIAEFCKAVQPEMLEKNSNFDHFTAEAIWIKGNITESVKLFDKVYRDNCYLRRKIRMMLQNLIFDVITSRSEAALVNIIKFSDNLVRDFKDYFPLTCVWQVCFLSEWYTDQCTAINLFENSEGLRKSVVNRIPYVVAVSLRAHRTEIVYQLLELVLRYEMKDQYTRILIALLEYQYQMRDVRSCLEIIQWSLKNDVDLPNVHHENFIKLLIKHNIQVPHKLILEKIEQPTFKF